MTPDPNPVIAFLNELGRAMRRKSLESCWCAVCAGTLTAELADSGELTPLEAMSRMRMHLCPGCGNKRCPRATQHDRRCTQSNEPGQPGSRYEGQYRRPNRPAAAADELTRLTDEMGLYRTDQEDGMSHICPVADIAGQRISHNGNTDQEAS